MSRELFLAAIASALTVLAGCDKTAVSSGDGESPAGVPVEVDVRVGDVTKGCYTTENLKAESFYLSLIQATVNRYNYNSVAFSYDPASGKWLPERQMLFDKKEPAVSFFAVAPSQNVDFDILEKLQYRRYEGTGFTLFSSEVAAVQTRDDRSSDLITAYALDCFHSGNSTVGNTYKPVDNKIALRFQHVLSRFIVRLALGTEFNHGAVPEENPVTDFTVGGSVREYAYGWGGASFWDGSSLYRDGTPSRVEGKYLLLGATASGADASDISPYQTSWTYTPADRNKSCVAVYECVFVPQTVQFTIKFKLGGRPYRYTMPAARALTAPGQNYRLNLTVRNGEVSADSDDIAATPWTDGGVTDIETD